MQEAAALLARMRKAIVDHETKFGKPRTEPIEMTKEEYERFKASAKVLYHTEGAPTAFYGVPIVIKE